MLASPAAFLSVEITGFNDGGGGAGLFMLTGELCLGELTLGAVEEVKVPDSELMESGDLQTGTRLDLCSMSFCRIGLEISRFLMLALSGFCFLGNELNFPPCFSFSLTPPPSLSATDSEGVLLTFEISLEKLDLSLPGSGLVLSLFTSDKVLLFDSSMRQTCAWVATGAGWLDQVGVISLPTGSSLGSLG